MRSFFLITIILFTSQVVSQSYPFKISGKIQSEKEKTPIEAATIHIERAKDSSVVSYTISNDKGNFSLEGKSFYKNLRLVVSFVGMQSYEKNVLLSKKSTYNLKTINLREEANLLDEIVVKSRAPITVKKDTLEFNVKSFKTKKDANVEDLLKQLPGVEIDEQGKITVNGKPVNKILVNGKPFFGNDPSITTKNLTKDIIEKIQITSSKTKSQSFTGEKGDENNKTINLTIKEENNKGWFGRIAAGAGTDKKYEAAAMVNRFNNDTRISVLLGMNNINSPGFSFGEIQKMFGDSNNVSFSGGGSFNIGGRQFGGGQGLVKSKTGGFTYADNYGKKVDVNMSYFYSGSNSEDKSRVERKNFFINRPDFYSNSSSETINDNDNHSINGGIDFKITPTFLVNVNPNFVFNKREGFYKQFQESLNDKRLLVNQLNSSNTIKSIDNRFENSIDFTKKLNKKGSFIRVRLGTNFNTSKSDEYNNSTTKFFDTKITNTRKQYTDSDTDYRQLSSSIKYRYAVIPDTLFLDVSYKYADGKQKNVRNTFGFNTITNSFEDFNKLLSSDFEYDDIEKTPSLGVTYRRKKWNANLETSYVFRILKNKDKLRPMFNLSRNFKALALNMNFSYHFDNSASVYSGYTLSSNPPQLRSLQAFENVTNPLNITKGNPNLKPSNSHRLHFGFNKFNWQKRTDIFANLDVTVEEDKVSSKSTLDEKLVRKTTYENVNGNYSIRGGGSFSKRFNLDSLKTLRVRLGMWGNIRNNVFFEDGIKQKSRTFSFTPNTGLTFNWREIMEISPSYSISLSRAKYDTSNTLRNQNFVRHRFNIQTKTTVPRKLEWSNNIRYTYNPQITEGFSKSAWFWNSTLSYSVFKDKGILSLKAYDVLNRNNNSNRIVSDNFVEDREGTVLKQYFMLGFSWKFNSLGKEREVKDSYYF